jgi:hypothetical protein
VPHRNRKLSPGLSRLGRRRRHRRGHPQTKSLKVIFGLIILSQVASTDFDAAAGKVVEYVSINGHTLASNFTTPLSKICDGFYPAVTQANVLPYITDAVDRLEVPHEDLKLP